MTCYVLLPFSLLSNEGLRIRCRGLGPLAPDGLLHHRNAHGSIVAHVLAANAISESSAREQSNRQANSMTSAACLSKLHCVQRRRFANCHHHFEWPKCSPARMQLLLLHLSLSHPSFETCVMPHCVCWKRTVATCSRPFNPALKFEGETRTKYLILCRKAKTSMCSTLLWCDDEIRCDARPSLKQATSCCHPPDVESVVGGDETSHVHVLHNPVLFPCVSYNNWAAKV